MKQSNSLRFMLLTLLVSMLGFGKATAQEAYVVYSDGKLTFYYDSNKSGKAGDKYSLTDVHENGIPKWISDHTYDITSASFDASFANARPQTTKYWFYGLGKVQIISGLRYLNTSEVTDMSCMFYNCENLIYLDTSNFDTGKVKTVRSMFYNCRNLKELDFGRWNTKMVTDFYGMFMQCRSFLRLDLSSFDFSSAENLDKMFFQCSGLKYLGIGSPRSGSLTSAEYIFFNCKELLSIFTGDWNTANLTKSEGMFSGCEKLNGNLGTVFDSQYTDKTYARPDGGSSTPGYFTLPRLIDYAVCEGNWLVFHHDYLCDTWEGDVYDISVDPVNWPAWINEHALDIEHVEFNSSFANIRPTSTAAWFATCSNLKSIINMKYLNTSEVTDMTYMFGSCENLEDIDVSGFDTRKVKSMSWMFFGCSSVSSLDVSGFNTGNVEFMGNMFYNCNALGKLELDNFNTSQVKDMSGMFGYCTGLTTLDLSKFETDNVENMQEMFDNCSNLKTLHISNFNTSKVVSMSHMFSHCESLSSLDLSHFDTSNVENMSDMFWDCEALTSLQLRSFDTHKVTDMSLMFCACYNLQSLDLSNFDTRQVTTMERMFDDSFRLETLNLISWDTSNVKNMVSMFNGCSGLTTINVGNGWNTDNVTDDGDMFYICKMLVGGQGTPYDENYTDKTYARADEGTTHPGYLTYVGPEAYAEYDDNGTLTFYYDYDRITRMGLTFDLDECEWRNYDSDYRMSITKVVFDASFKDARPTSTADWFANLENLQTITGMKENLNTSQVTNMTGMFWDCPLLTDLDLSNFKTGNVESMYGMFYACSSLTSLDLSNFDTSNVKNMNGMFYFCSNLASLNVSSFNTQNVTDMGNMFAACESLKTLDVSSFDTQNVQDMEYMFYECEALKTLDLSSFFTWNVVNMEGMFLLSTGLQTIYVSDGWSTTNVTKSENMFNGCFSIMGSLGTTLDEKSFSDDEFPYVIYAHIDGGEDNPGYLSEKKLVGDANGNGVVDGDDVKITVRYIMGENPKGFYVKAADMNGDTKINAVDVTKIINIINNK